MHIQTRLRLIIATSCSITPKGKDGEDLGFSLPLFLAVSLILLIGGALIVNRSADSVFAGSYSTKAREAQKAAEAGAAYLIAQLNAPENRRLLVYQPGDTEAESTQLTSTTNLNLIRRNPCLSTTSNPSYTKLYPGGDATEKWYIQPDGTISTTPSNLSFRLKSFKREPIDDIYISRNRNEDGTNRFVLQVIGESLRSGNVVASATLEQDWDVAPKCCGVGFGGGHGNADYGIDSDGESICILDGLGLGILAGAAGTETGAITIKGYSSEIESDEGVEVNPIYCLSTTGSGCSIDTKGTDINVEIIPEELPGPKSWTSPSPSVLTDSVPTSNGTIASCGSSTMSVACDSKSSTSSFAYCVDSCKITVINPAASTLPSFCALGSLSGVPEVHCNIEKLDPGNDKIIFDTKTRRIVLYFPTGGSSTPSSRVKVANAGRGLVGHCALSTSSFTETTLSSACGAPANAIRLSMFGCKTCGVQTLTLNGTPSLDLNAFIYFPNGQISLIGTADISGIVWANTLGSTGSPTWTVPGSGLASVLDFMGILPDDDDDSAKNPLLFDMTARSLNRSRWIMN